MRLSLRLWCSIIAATLLFALFPAQKLTAQYTYSAGDPSALASWTPMPPNFNSGTFTINTPAIALSNWTLGGTAQLTIGAAGSLTVNTGFVVTANSNVTVNGGLTLSGTGDQLVLNAGVPITLGPTATVTGTGRIKADNNNTVTIQCAAFSPTWFTSGWIFRLVIDRLTDITCNASLIVGPGGLQLANSGNLFFPGVGYSLTIENGLGVSQMGTGKVSLIGGGNTLVMQDDNLNGDHYVPGMNNLYINHATNVNLINTMDMVNLTYGSGTLTIENTGNLTRSGGNFDVPASRTLIINSGGRVTAQTGGAFTCNGTVNINSGGLVMVQPNATFGNNGVVNVAAGGMVVLDADMTNNSTVGGANPINYVAATSILRYTATGTPPVKVAGAELPLTTMPGRVEVARNAGSFLQINKVTTIQGGIDVQSGTCSVTAAGNVTLNGTSNVQSGAALTVNTSGQLTNSGVLNILAGSTFRMTGGAPYALFGGTSPVYSVTSLLEYDGGIVRTTGTELPSPMDGDIRLQGASGITLGASTVMNGNFYTFGGANTLTVPSALRLTLANTGNSISATSSLTAQSPSGEVRITGSLSNGGALNVPGILTLSGAGALTGTAPTMFTGTLQYLNKTPATYTTGLEFPATVGNLIINSAAATDAIILANAKTVSGNTTITQGVLQTSAVSASLTHSLGVVNLAANGTLRVQENSVLSGGSVTYSAAAAKLEYAGTMAKTTPGPELPMMFGGSILVNNSGGVNAPASTLTMSGANFNLTLGNWRIPASGGLVLGPTTSLTGGSATSYVETAPAANTNNAFFMRNVPAGFTVGFPIGTSVGYRPLDILSPSATANVSVGASAATPTGTTNTPPFLGSASSPGYWYVSAASACNAQVRVQHPSVMATSKLGSFAGLTAAGAYGDATASVGGSLITSNAYSLNTLTFFALGTGPAATSDVVAATGPVYTYTAPITITEYNAAANLGGNVTATSISLFEFDVRDLGGDALQTELNTLNFTLNDLSGQLQRIALYDGATELGEINAVNGALSFTGLTLSIPDNTTKRLALRCTFKSNVADNANIQFSITSAVANSSYSAFAAFAALTSSVAGNNNRVSVVATQLAFPNAVGNQIINTNFSPAVDVRAVDVNNNLDLDVTGTMTLMGAPIAVSAGGSVVLSAGVGVGTFNALQMASAGGGNTLTATLGALTGTSAPFTVSTIPTYWGCTIPSTPPALPVLGIGGRNMNFNGVSLNGGGNSLAGVTPGQAILLTGNWMMNWPGGVYCPGCVVQMYVGIGTGSGFAGDGSSAAGFTHCIGTGVYNGSSGSMSYMFNAPTKPGIYYIAQNWSLHYYCNPHPVTFSNDPSYAIAVIQVIDPVPPSQGCNEADIIPTPGFTYQTNIPYASYTGAMSATHPTVWSFRIRDYGTIPTQADIDNKPTQITAIGINVTDPNGVLQEIALYNGAGLIETQTVSGSGLVTFSSAAVAANLLAPDDGVVDILVRARFRTAATTPPMDNQNFSFTINQANVTMAAPPVSTQKAAFAVAGPSSTAGNNNRVEVIATQYGFQTAPPATVNAAVVVTPTAAVQAEDANNNIDLDYAGAVTISTLPTNYVIAGATGTIIAGVATLPTLTLSGGTAPIVGQQLTASGALTSGASTAFTINPSVFHQMMSGVNAAVLGNWQLNGAGANPTALGVPGATYIIGATPGANPSTVTVSAPLTINPNSTLTVNNGSTLVVNNGIGVTNNGALTVNGGGLLQLLGTGSILAASMNSVNYAATSATLQYSDPSAAGRTATLAEMPPMFPGSLMMSRVGIGANSFNFGGSKTIAGQFQKNATGTININTGEILTLQGGSTLSAGTLNFNGTGSLTVAPTGTFLFANGAFVISGTGSATFNGGFSNPSGNLDVGVGALNLNGAINFGGGGINSPVGFGTLRIAGTGGISGTLNNISAGYALVEINRAGATVALAPGNLVTDDLSLLNGIIQTAGITFHVQVDNTLTHSGSASTYIDGKLRRRLSTAALMNAGPFDFPLGKLGRYLPLGLYNVSAAANTDVEAEAFSMNPSGMNGSQFSNISTTEYWETSEQAGTLVSARVQLSRAAPAIPTAGVVGYSGASNGMYTGLGGGVTAPNVLSISAAPTPATNRFYAIGSLPNTFFYFSGAAENPASWNSQLDGLGAPAIDFVSTGQTFIVPNGRTATFSNNATFGNAMAAVFVQVESGGTLAVETGKTLTANTALRINGGGRLRLEGTAAVVAPSGVQYLAPTATLEYNNAMMRLTNESEILSLPNIMQGSIELKNSTIILNGAKSLQNLTLDNSTLHLGVSAGNANTLTINGALTAAAMTPTATIASDSTNRLTIAGTGAIAGSFTLSGNIGSLTMNRAGQTLNLKTTTTISTTLTLTAGNIGMAANTMLLVQNPAQNAIVNSGGSSYVVGVLARSLSPSLTPMTPSNYAYPVGTATRFLPMVLQNSTTGSAGAVVAAEGIASGAGGSVVPGVTGALSSTEHWRVLAVSGEFTGGVVSLVRNTPVLNAQNRVGTSTVRTGGYATAGGAIVTTPFGTALQSDPVQHGASPFAMAGAERFYSVVGILPNAPRIFGFSPSSGGSGTTIRVTGANFSTITAVAIGGVPVFGYTLQGDSTFVATIANGVSGAVQVSGTAGGATSDSIFRFIPPPTVRTVIPNPAGYGAPITIQGDNFQYATYLSIGGVAIPVTPNILTPSNAFAVNVPLNASNATIVISSPGGSVESTDALVLVQRPVILNVSPQTASTGEIITLIGRHFTGTRFVRFGGGTSRIVSTNANFTVNSSERLSVIVPPQVRRTTTGATAQFSGKDASMLNAASELVPISVETPGGITTTGTLAATQFFYRETAQSSGGGGGNVALTQVRIDVVLDKIALAGGRVTVTGANFDLVRDIRLSTVVGSTQASWFTNSATNIQIVVPTSGLLRSTSQTASSIATTIELFGPNNVAIATNAFVLVSAPRLTSITPRNAEPGETITLTGTDLTLITQITINGQPIPYRVNPDGTVTLTMPTETSTTGSVNPPAGPIVIRGVGGSTVSDHTNVINQPYLLGTPIITSFSPATGAGGTIVVVTGANFSAVTDVLVGGIPVQSFVVNSSGRLTIVLSTEAAARNTGVVTLVTARGTVESRQNFTFTQSLENDINTLARGIGLPPNEIQSRVQTVNNQIVGIDLSNIPLPNGAFPTFIRPYTRLRYLSLRNTQLKEQVPMWASTFRDLEELDISQNELTGPLQTEPVCGFPNLRLLNVSYNRMEGSIPACITTRERLQTLRLDNNRFTGSIPQELGTMPNLRVLTLNNNDLTGSIPAAFGNLSLNKSRTNLARTVAGKTSAVTNDAQSLEVLDASNNQLSGTLPPTLGNMVALKTLNLANNRLSGAVPQELANVRTLENLNLSGNRFSGEIPTLFGQLSRLRVLRLQNNFLTGVPDIASARRLDTLELQSNRLDFASIEPYMPLLAVPSIRFAYTPQDSVGDAARQAVQLGQALTLSVRAGGSANRYEWFKNGVVVRDANAATLTFAAASASDAGVYVCRITSDRVLNLVLVSRPQTVVVTTSGVTLAAPELLYPAQNAENVGVQTRLAWTRIAGVDGYEVQWAEDPGLRSNVERRFVPQNSRDTLPTMETRISGLRRGVQVYWRVRAVAGAESSQNTSQWADARNFGIVPLGVDLAIATIDAGKASIGDEVTGQSVAVNVGTDALLLDDISVDAADAGRFRLTTTLTQGTMLPAGAEFPVKLTFSPQQTGFTTGTLRVRYRDGQGTAREVSFKAVARGSGSALAVEPVNFDTVRVGRRTLRTAELINRGTDAVKILRARILLERGQASNDATFAVQDVIDYLTPPRIAPGDTLPILLGARPQSAGQQRGTLELIVASTFGTVSPIENGFRIQGGGWLDTLLVSVRGIAREPQKNDAALFLGIRAVPDSVAPGGTTTIEVFIRDSSNKAAVLAAAQPQFQGAVRINRQVLSLAKTNTNGARSIPERTGTSDVQRIAIPQTSWDGRSDVLFRFDALAVAGSTDVSKLEIENLAWGNLTAQAQRQPWESQVFIEEPQSSVFVAKACEAGGKRLVTSAKATALAVVRPNPVKDVAEVAMTLREDGAILLELVNMQGKVLKTIATGDHLAGEYALQVNCADIPSGTYMIRLRTNNDALSRALTIVR